ncbi:MAG: hypothetical protein KKC85_03740, partial [Gammaproteobacteria bacterium]|nr:hypothetical protein [Gammaproteobacteria bacterium]
MASHPDELERTIARLTREPDPLHMAGRRRFFVTALASGIAGASLPALAQPAGVPAGAGSGRLTIGDGG